MCLVIKLLVVPLAVVRETNEFEMLIFVKIAATLLRFFEPNTHYNFR